MRIPRLLQASAFALASMLALSLPALADDYDCPNIDRAVQVFNRSNSTIVSLYAYNRDSMGNGAENMLESPLEPGDDTTVLVDDGTGYHVFNFEAFTDGDLAAYTEVDACSTSAMWFIEDSDIAEEDDY